MRETQLVLSVLVMAAATAAVWLLVPRPGAGPDAVGPAPRRSTAGARADLQPAPDFEIELYQGEQVLRTKTVRLSQVWQGHPVVLNFWAGLCPPCRVEMPDFQKLHAGAGGQFTLIGVDIGPFTRLGTREDGQALLLELGVTFPAGTTHEAGTVAAYKILGMPTTVFITPQGMIFRKYAGLLTFDLMGTFVTDLLGASEVR
jgi:thiol-disulfide isomerase/thioredoxin